MTFTGTIDTLERPRKICGPKVWGFNFKTGKVLHEIDLTYLCCPESRLQYIIADYGLCGQGYLYISDAGTGSIIVHDVNSKRSGRVPLPIEVAHSCPRDILYMFLIRPHRGENLLGFTYLSGSYLYLIRTSNLRNGNYNSIIRLGPKPREVVPLGTDNAEVLFFRYKTEGKIYGWDTNTDFQQCNFNLVDKGKFCRWSTQVVGGSRCLMWSLDSNFQDFTSGVCGNVGASASIRPLTYNDDDKR